MKQTQNRWFHRFPRASMWLFNLLIILLLDVVVANSYYWLFGYTWVDRKKVRSKLAEQQFRIPQRVYHHDLAPETDIAGVPWGSWRYDMRTNSLGFKDKSVREVPMTSDRHRLLFIGDSFTEGVGFEYADTFIGMVDSTLAAQQIEVLNAGVVSYSPLIYWRKVKYWLDAGLQFDEVVVYIDMSDTEDDAEYYFLREDSTVGRDVQLDSLRNLPGPVTLQSLIRNNTIVTFWLMRALREPFLSEAEILLRYYGVNRRRGNWTFDTQTFAEYGEKGLAAMDENMDQLHRLLASRNIPLSVAVYPWPDQIYYGDLHSRQMRFWEEWCAVRGVRFINYFPAFVKGDTAEERKRVIERYFIRGDVHWNLRGHRVIADGFLENYRKPNSGTETNENP